MIFVGDKGKLTCGSYGNSPRLIPESRMKDYKRPEPSIPRSVGHHKEWIDACKGGDAPSANFEYGAALTEVPGVSQWYVGGVVSYANEVKERLLGVPREEHVQRGIDTPEWRIVRPDGSPMPVEEYASVRALNSARGSASAGVERRKTRLSSNWRIWEGDCVMAGLLAGDLHKNARGIPGQ